MAQETIPKRANSRTPRPGLSLDSWAVLLAFILSLAIWAGWIKHVPW